MNLIRYKFGVFLSFCAVGIGLAFLRPHSASIVTFNAAEVRGKFIRQLAKHAASDVQVHKTSIAFKHQLNVVLAEYAKSHHVVIVDSKTVLSGARDLTVDILLNLPKARGGK